MASKSDQFIEEFGALCDKYDAFGNYHTLYGRGEGPVATECWLELDDTIFRLEDLVPERRLKDGD